MIDVWVCSVCSEELMAVDLGQHAMWHREHDEHPPPSVTYRHKRVLDPADVAEEDLETS